MELEEAVPRPAPLAVAQDELSNSLREEGQYTLLRAKADGNCFYHALRLGRATDLSIKTLREQVNCPLPGEAEEDPLNKTSDGARLIRDSFLVHSPPGTPSALSRLFLLWPPLAPVWVQEEVFNIDLFQRPQHLFLCEPQEEHVLRAVEALGIRLTVVPPPLPSGPSS